jgi:hypothetical protein
MKEYMKTREHQIDIARRLIATGISKDLEEVLEQQFPELAESEDKSVRKWLIDEIKSIYDFESPHLNPMVEKALAYLEKQKEQKDFQAKVEKRMEYLWDKLPDAHKVEEGNCTPEEWKTLGAYMELEMNFDKGSEEKQKEDKEELVYRLNGLMQDYINESKDDEEKTHRFKCYCLFWDALEDADFFEPKEQKPSTPEDIAAAYQMGLAKGRNEQKPHRFCDDTLEAIDKARKFDEQMQKPAEWSEEDETCLENALWCVEKTRHFVAKDACDFDACRSAKRLLESLPERFNLQPKQEWSEEDNIIKNVISYLNGEYVFKTHDDDYRKGLIRQLKSLRPQPHYKPSEEQMEAFHSAIASKAVIRDAKTQNQLEGLYNDLLTLQNE